MPKEEAAKAVERAHKRAQNSRRDNLAISPEIYLVAEMGYYFGWEAVLAVRRGYTVGYKWRDVKDEKPMLVKEPFTLEEAQVLLEGARKVWYSKLAEQTHSGMISNSFNSSSRSFDSAIKPFTEKAEVKE